MTFATIDLHVVKVKPLKKEKKLENCPIYFII